MRSPKAVSGRSISRSRSSSYRSTHRDRWRLEESELTSQFDPATLLTSVVEVDTTHIAKKGFRGGTD